MREVAGLDELKSLSGTELGSGEWVTVTQTEIDRFAEATDDHQWIHTDPARAAAGPFGGTIAHGFLTLALLPPLMRSVWRLNGVTTIVNYGLNRVRFLTPVPAGGRLRATSRIADVQFPQPTTAQVSFMTTIELEGSERPAAIVEHLSRYSVDE